MEKLKVKVECVNNVFEDAKNQLAQRIKSKPNDYKIVIKNLIVQGLIKLMEDKVTVFCKKEEYDMIQSILDQAKNEFVELLNKETKKLKNFQCEVIIDTKFYLPDNV